MRNIQKSNVECVKYIYSLVKNCVSRVVIFFVVAGSPILLWAQESSNCQISLGYSSLAINAVPGLTLFGIGTLVCVMGVMVWFKRSGSSTGVGRKLLSLALGVFGGLLSMQGGGLIQAVRAAGVYEFSNSSGGIVSDTSIPYANPSPFITISNTSGVRVNISSNANPNETGSCKVGAVIAPGGSCTTAAVCPDYGSGSGGNN